MSRAEWLSDAVPNLGRVQDEPTLRRRPRTVTEAAERRRHRGLPFGDPSRRQRLVKVGAWLVGIALAVVVLRLLGVDVIGWLSDLWDQIKDIPTGYMVAALAFQTGQTLLAGLSYYGILRAAYPGQVEFWPIVTAYAVGVAMNNFLPANIGTFVTLIMFVAIIPTATFAGSIAAYLVQKIFFTIAGTFVYLYLFLSVPGSFTENLGNLSEHPVASIAIAVGAVVLIVILGRIFWRQVKKLWAQGQAGRRDPLAPEGVPHARVSPVAPLVAVQADRDRDLPGRIRDPGHVRVDHVGDRLGLARQHRLRSRPARSGSPRRRTRSRSTRAAMSPTSVAVDYSTAQQLITTAWNVLFALVLVILVFGWTGGKLLVGESYGDAKVKVADQKTQRAAKKEAKRASKGKD